MARRGFLAELQHQRQIAAREQARRAQEAERARNAANRAAEQAQRAKERAAAQLTRATAADQKRLAKEAQEAHIAAMEAEAERRNLELSELYSEIDSLLSATLDVDDYVDLATLRAVAEHPPFDRVDLETPVPAPSHIPDPPEPIFTPPSPPGALRGLLGGKKHEVAVAEALAAHEVAVTHWKSALVDAESARKAAASQHADLEAKRLAALQVERARYAEECAAREAAVADRNKAVDTLIADLGYGAVHAVQEYVSIVLSNSVYPSHFPVEHDFEYEPTIAELRLRVVVPGPDKVPTISAHKYSKSTNEITTTTLSQKACKDRYTNAVLQVALRSLHEVFEADRRGLIKTISLQVGTEAIDPATGREAHIPFVAVAANRERFLEFNLANVVPAATLSHLGAAVSKSPYDLAPVNTSGIRRS
jgi:restriction system protein